MPNEINQTFLIIAQNIMKSVSYDKVTPSAKKTIQNYIAEGLQSITTTLHISYSLDDIPRVELSLMLPHGYKLDREEDVVEILEAVGVTTENTPGTYPVPLNRFSGININE